MSKISIVILNWNGSGMLRSFLPSVIKWSALPDVEICVADNGSTDDSIEMLKAEFPSVRIIGLGENYGFAEGYNQALQHIKAKYVVLLNSDVEVTEGWLTSLTDYMDAHPEVAACQPKIRAWNNKEIFEYAGAAGGYIDRYGYPFCRGRILNTLEKDRGQYDEPAPIFWATGAALFIRLKDYWGVGGLDGRFFAHMEEIDLCWRLHACGREIMCIPQSTVYHVGGATLKKENPRKTFLNFRNNLLMLYKNLPDKELGRVMRMRRVLDYVAAVTFALKGQYPNAKAIYRARKEFNDMRKFLIAARKENLRKAIIEVIPEKYTGSIIFAYYLKNKKRFSQLKFTKP